MIDCKPCGFSGVLMSRGFMVKAKFCPRCGAEVEL